MCEKRIGSCGKGCEFEMDCNGSCLPWQLREFDRCLPEGLKTLRATVVDDELDLITLARKRFAWGYEHFNDRNFQKWAAARFEKEAAEELADAIVYLTRARFKS